MSNEGMSEFHLHDMAGSLAKGEQAYVRTVISKFGGTIKEGPIVSIPPQKHNKHDRTYLAMHPKTAMEGWEMRHQPSHVVAHQGIPGYAGHKAHNPTWNNPHRRPDLRSEFVRPYLEAEGKTWMADEENYTPQRPHTIDHEALNNTDFPKRMPPPGYTGHLPHAKTQSYGISHWRPNQPVSRAQAAEAAKRSAERRAAMFKPAAPAAKIGGPTKLSATGAATTFVFDDAFSC